MVEWTLPELVGLKIETENSSRKNPSVALDLFKTTLIVQVELKNVCH